MGETSGAQKAENADKRRGGLIPREEDLACDTDVDRAPVGILAKSPIQIEEKKRIDIYEQSRE